MSNTSSSLNILAQGTVDGLGAFLGRICLPAAEELGLALQDKVKEWRAKNFTEILINSKSKIENRGDLNNPKIHPRILYSIYEHGSWTDSNTLQEMWAGIFSSSCEEDSATDKNIIYIDILSKLSHDEATLFEYFCKSTQWSASHIDNLVGANPIFPNVGELKKVTSLDSFEDIDQALSHLQFLGLIMRETIPTMEKLDSDKIGAIAGDSQFGSNWLNHIEVTVTSLGLRLFLKVKGKNIKPSQFISEWWNNN